MKSDSRTHAPTLQNIEYDSLCCKSKQKARAQFSRGLGAGVGTGGGPWSWRDGQGDKQRAMESLNSEMDSWAFSAWVHARAAPCIQGVCVRASFTHKIPKWVRASRLEAHFLFCHHYTSQSLLSLWERRLVTITLFSLRIGQGVDERIPEYALRKHNATRKYVITGPPRDLSSTGLALRGSR